MFTDDRILTGMSMLGAEPQTMQEVLYKLIMDASEKFVLIFIQCFLGKRIYVSVTAFIKVVEILK